MEYVKEGMMLMLRKTMMKESLCPSCGGKMTFDPASQKNVCDTCGNSYIINPYKTLEELASDNQKSKCPNCGATLQFDPEAQQAVCSACDSSFSLIQDKEKSPVFIKPEFIKPFATSAEQAKICFVEWLNEGEMVPDNVFEDTSIVSQRGKYIPIWNFQGQYRASYSASVGYDRQETYQELVNGRYVTKTRTVIDWSPYNGSVVGSFNINTAATTYFSRIRKADGTIADDRSRNSTFSDKNADISMAELSVFCVQNADVSTTVYDDRYTAGFDVIVADISSEDAFANQASDVLMEQLYGQIQQEAPGDYIKDIHLQMDELDVHPSVIAWPYWVTKYEYEAKGYLALTEGSCAADTNGTKPFDRKRAQKKNTVRAMSQSVSLFGLVMFIIWVVQTIGDIGYSEDRAFFLYMCLGCFVLSIIGAIATKVFGSILGKQSKKRRSEVFEAIHKTPSLLFEKISQYSEEELSLDDPDRRIAVAEEIWSSQSSKTANSFVSKASKVCAIIEWIFGILSVPMSFLFGGDYDLSIIPLIAFLLAVLGGFCALMFVGVAFIYIKPLAEYNNEFQYKQEKGKLTRRLKFILLGFVPIIISAIIISIA